jgi:hypothetical protein
VYADAQAARAPSEEHRWREETVLRCDSGGRGLRQRKKGKAHLGVVSYVAKLKAGKAVGVAIAYMTDFYYLFLQAHCC